MIFDSRAARVRIPQEAPRVRLDELMTFTGLILWVVQAYIEDSGFAVIFGTELGKLIRYFCLLLFLVRILLSDMHLAARAFSVAAVFFCYLMMIQKMAGSGITFLQLFVMMMAVKDISFKKICKVMFWTCLTCYLGVLLFDKIGLIWRPPLIDGDRVRDYMGFRFVSFPSFYIFNLFFCGAYAYTGSLDEVRRIRLNRQCPPRLPLWSLAVLEGINLLVYIRTNTNIPFLITTFFVFLYLVSFYGGIDLFPDCGLMRFLAGACYPMLACRGTKKVRHPSLRPGRLPERRPAVPQLFLYRQRLYEGADQLRPDLCSHPVWHLRHDLSRCCKEQGHRSVYLDGVHRRLQSDEQRPHGSGTVLQPVRLLVRPGCHETGPARRREKHLYRSASGKRSSAGIEHKEKYIRNRTAICSGAAESCTGN